jgi:hypothetical protein
MNSEAADITGSDGIGVGSSDGRVARMLATDICVYLTSRSPNNKAWFMIAPLRRS